VGPHGAVCTPLASDAILRPERDKAPQGELKESNEYTGDRKEQCGNRERAGDHADETLTLRGLGPHGICRVAHAVSIARNPSEMSPTGDGLLRSEWQNRRAPGNAA
jgi:hypothetical protein